MWKIIRTNDGKTFEVDEYKFIVFENGHGKELVEKPKIGTSLILPNNSGKYNGFYLWLTSPITEIEDNYNFKTNNSTYEIRPTEIMGDM